MIALHKTVTVRCIFCNVPTRNLKRKSCGFRRHSLLRFSCPFADFEKRYSCLPQPLSCHYGLICNNINIYVTYCQELFHKKSPTACGERLNVLFYRTVGIKERKWLKIGNVVTQKCVALGKNTHLTDNIASCLFYKRFYCTKRLAC